MTHLFLLRSPLRRKQRSGRRKALGYLRLPRLEQLDRRLVLSGMADFAYLSTSADSSSDTQGADVQAPPVENAVVPDVASPRIDSFVYLTADNLLHVQGSGETGSVVVRQFIDFRLEEVVEIERAGQWIAFPARQVRAVQIHLADSAQTANVDAGVSKPVQLVQPLAIDEAVTDSSQMIADDLVGSRADTSVQVTMADASVPLALPADTPSSLTSLAEGEPGGSTAPPILAPPRISGFTAVKEGDLWQLSGQVTDDKSVSGLVVRFGGLLDGSSAIVNEQGHFQIIVTFPPGTSGLVTAQTTDTDGLTSNLAYCSINY